MVKSLLLLALICLSFNSCDLREDELATFRKDTNAQNGFKAARSSLHGTVKVAAFKRSGTLEYVERGTGVVVDANGLIVTNYHIVDAGNEFSVTLYSGITIAAELIASYPEMDLAILKINKTGLSYIKFGRSTDLQLGDRVFAVGNPGDLGFSLTSGVVGAFNRQTKAITYPNAIERFIQTDVPTNPGCSGGPLLNSQGELVGINTAIFSQTGRFEGYSFAQPVEMVRDIMRELRYSR